MFIHYSLIYLEPLWSNFSQLFRARQKLKKVEALNQGQSVLSAATASTVLAMTTIVSSSSSGSPTTPKPLSDEAKRGLTKWVEEHQVHPFPSRGEKDALKKLYGIENDPQLDGFLCRARKKYKKKMDESKSIMAAPTGQSAASAQTNANLSLSSGASTPTIANLTTKAQAAVSQTATNQVATNPQNTKFSSLASLFSAAELHAARNQNQATTAPPQVASYGTHNGNGPSTTGGDRSREAAIISSFQSLKEMDSHTQDSRALIDKATADYSSYQRQLGQQGANGNSSYNQQGQHAGHGSYQQQGGTGGHYQQQQYHQVQQHQRVSAPATYSSHSQHAVSHQNSQQQQGTRPSAYPYQHSQGQHQQQQQQQQQQRAFNPTQHQQSQSQQGHSYSQGKPNNGQH